MPFCTPETRAFDARFASGKALKTRGCFGDRHFPVGLGHTTSGSHPPRRLVRYEIGSTLLPRKRCAAVVRDPEEGTGEPAPYPRAGIRRGAGCRQARKSRSYEVHLDRKLERMLAMLSCRITGGVAAALHRHPVLPFHGVRLRCRVVGVERRTHEQDRGDAADHFGDIGGFVGF
jgi:hypothetical protein